MHTSYLCARLCLLPVPGLWCLHVCVFCLFHQAQASKTRDVVAQQRVVILLEERLKAAAAPIATAKVKRDKVQGFLRVRVRLPGVVPLQ